MDLFLSEQQKMLKKAAHDFLSQKCPADYLKRMETDELGYSRALWREIADMGWLGLVFPSQYGGTDMSFFDLVLLLEEMGFYCFTGPFFPTVVLGGLTILNVGTEEQKQEFLPKIANGDTLLSLAYSEPEVDYAIDCIDTKASYDDGYFFLRGTKLFVPDAHIANYVICAANRETTDKTKRQVDLFLVNMDTNNITIAKLDSISPGKYYAVTFDNVKVPVKNILGNNMSCAVKIENTLQFASIAKCAEMVGGAQRVLEMAVSYAKERVQFGQPIGNFQAIQHYCANMLIDVNSSRLITYKTAWMLSEKLQCTKEISIAKAWVNEAFTKVCMTAHQIHGAIGFTKDHDLQLFTRAAKVSEGVYGDTHFHREVIAQQIGL